MCHKTKSDKWQCQAWAIELIHRLMFTERTNDSIRSDKVFIVWSVCYCSQSQLISDVYFIAFKALFINYTFQVNEKNEKKQDKKIKKKRQRITRRKFHFECDFSKFYI